MKPKLMTENELSNIVIGKAIDIHRTLGPGLLESVYEAALVHDLLEFGLFVQSQVPVTMIYKNVRMEVGFRLDILVENKLVVEVKSIETLAPLHHAQTLTYLRLTGCKLGLLINFNTTLLKDGVHRIANGL
jgi:GxxExxY protein